MAKVTLSHQPTPIRNWVVTAYLWIHGWFDVPLEFIFLSVSMSGSQRQTRQTTGGAPSYDYTQDTVLDYRTGATELDRLLQDARRAPLCDSSSESEVEDFKTPSTPAQRATDHTPQPSPKKAFGSGIPIFRSVRAAFTSKPATTAPSVFAYPDVTTFTTQTTSTTSTTSSGNAMPGGSTGGFGLPGSGGSPNSGNASIGTGILGGGGTIGVGAAHGGGSGPARTTVTTVPLLPGNDCYDGHGHVEDFLHRFEALAKVHGWDSDAKAYYFPLYLTGTCKNWFRTFLAEYRRKKNDPTADVPFAEMKKRFQEVFASKITEDELEQRLRNRKRVEGETIYDYFYSVMRLCDRLHGIDDPKRVKYLLKGLPRDLATNLFLQKPKTPSDILELLESHEQFEFVVGGVKQEKKGFGEELDEQLQGSKAMTKTFKHFQSTLDRLSNKLEKLSLPTPTSVPTQASRNVRFDRAADGKFYCWFCDSDGHRASNCPRRSAQRRLDNSRAHPWCGFAARMGKPKERQSG